MSRKRANGEGSIRKRENGTWEARIQLGNDPVTGKPIRKSVYAKTQKEARSKLQELIEKKKSQNYNQVEDEKLTLDTWLDMWLNNYLVDIKPALGSIPLKRLRTPMIQEFYNNLQKNGLSSKFIKNIHGVLHRALDMAVRVEYLQKNPSTYTVRPRVIEKPVSSIDTPEQKRLIAVLNMRPIGTILLIALYTGMRIGEILGLTWDKIDLDKGLIRVEGSAVVVAGNNVVYKETNKTKKSRRIVPIMIPNLHDALTAVPEKDRTGLVYKRNPTLIWEEVNRICEKNGLPPVGVHGLRHSFASLAFSSEVGMTEREVMEIGGWEDYQTVHKVYEHLSDKNRNEAAKKFAAFFQNANEKTLTDKSNQQNKAV